MTRDVKFSRRTLMSGAAYGASAALVGGFPGMRALAADSMVVGALYVGPKDDYGWNQAHSEGVRALKGMRGVTVNEEERVPETLEVQKSMESMIALDKASIIFATSYGYWDFMLKVAPKYPKAVLLHAGPEVWKDTMPKNVGSYNGYIDEAQYVAGIVAAGTSKTGKLGFVAAKPYPVAIRNINAFTLGARSVNPKATTQVIFTGDWVLPVKEAESVNTLADQGIDVVTCHVDSPKVVIETAEKRGVKTCGHAFDQGPLAPKGYITGADYNWIDMFETFVETRQRGGTLPNFVTGGYDKDYVRSSPFGAGATPEAINAATTAIQAMKNGDAIFVGPIMDNTGKLVVPAGTSYGPYADELQQTDYLIQGVIGSIA